MLALPLQEKTVKTMKQEMTKMMATAAVATMLCSCSIFRSVGISQARALHEGMTKDEVEALMGKAEYHRFGNGLDQWEYRSTFYHVLPQVDVVIIDFVNDRVAAMNSFREYHPTYPEPKPEKK